MLEPMHLRPPRHPTTLCGASAKSVRVTRRLSLATCPGCLDVLGRIAEAQKLEKQRQLLKRIADNAAVGVGADTVPIFPAEAAEAFKLVQMRTPPFTVKP